MIKRIVDIINYQYEKYKFNNKELFFIPFEDDSESELIEENLIQGYEIDIEKNSLKKSYDLTDFSLTNTKDSLNDLCNLLSVISKLSPKMLKSLFLYESLFIEFNKKINSFKSLMIKHQTLEIPRISDHNKFLSDKIKYFLEKYTELADTNKTSGELIVLSNNIKRIRETRLIFDEYYNIHLSNKYLYLELDNVNSMFFEFANLASDALRTTRFYRNL